MDGGIVMKRDASRVKPSQRAIGGIAPTVAQQVEHRQLIQYR